MPVAQYDPSMERAPGGSFREIVLQVKADLAAFLDIAPARVLVVADRKIGPRAVAETHLRVRPLDRRPDPDPGAGRLAAFKTRLVAVDVIVRSAADDAASDEVALCHETTGLFALEDKVVDCLDRHTPVRDGEPLTVQPMAETRTDDPNRPQPADGFAATTVYFEARYAPRYRLDQT